MTKNYFLPVDLKTVCIGKVRQILLCLAAGSSPGVPQLIIQADHILLTSESYAVQQNSQNNCQDFCPTSPLASWCQDWSTYWFGNCSWTQSTIKWTHPGSQRPHPRLPLQKLRPLFYAWPLAWFHRKFMVTIAYIDILGNFSHFSWIIFNLKLFSLLLPPPTRVALQILNN